MNIQESVLRSVTRLNWLIFTISVVLGNLYTSPGFTRGIFFGGLIVTVNFHLLARTLKRSLTPPHLANHHTVIAKYYIRFFISGLVIFFLISKNLVNPLGLFVGLSVVVASIMIVTLFQVKNLFMKEAV